MKCILCTAQGWVLIVFRPEPSSRESQIAQKMKMRKKIKDPKKNIIDSTQQHSTAKTMLMKSQGGRRSKHCKGRSVLSSKIIFTLPGIVSGVCTPPKYPSGYGYYIHAAVSACLAETPNGSCPIFASASNGTGCGNGGVNGIIGSWDVSKVTNMGQMFVSTPDFTSDLSKWRVDKVTSMHEMFLSASIFNSDISKWRVNKVIGMSQLFNGASKFNSDISAWNVYKVTTFGFALPNVQQGEYTHKLCGRPWFDSKALNKLSQVVATESEICAPCDSIPTQDVESFCFGRGIDGNNKLVAAAPSFMCAQEPCVKIDDAAKCCACGNGQGNTKNPLPCACGNALGFPTLCTQQNMYCNEESKLCSTFENPTCQYKNGLTGAFKDQKTKFLVISFSSDWLYPTKHSKDIVIALNASGANVAFSEIKTDKGHDSFLVNEPKFLNTIKGFIDSSYETYKNEKRI